MATIHSSNSNDPTKNPMMKTTSAHAASPLNPSVVTQAKQIAGSASPLIGAMPVTAPVTPAAVKPTTPTTALPTTPTTPATTPTTPVTTPSTPAVPVALSPTTTPAVDPLVTALKGSPQPVIQAEVKQLQSTVVADVKALTDLAGIKAPAVVADLQKALSSNAATLQSVSGLVTPTPGTTAPGAVPAGMNTSTRVDLDGLVAAVNGNANGVLQHLSSDLQNQIGLHNNNPQAPVNFTRIQTDINQVNTVAKAGGKVTKDIVMQQGQMVLQSLGIDPKALS